jgi:hypothetical protein
MATLGFLLTEALLTFLFGTTASEVTNLTRNVPLLGHQEVLLLSERFEILPDHPSLPCDPPPLPKKADTKPPYFRTMFP